MHRIFRMPSIELDTKHDLLPKRKLILHFDQHNTIQVASSLPDRHLTVEEGLNNFLTSACWGRETYDNEWEWISNEPQINKPEPNAMTYFKYLEKKIVKEPDDRPELKKQTGRFVYDEPGKKFKEFFDLYLQSLTYESNYNPLATILNETDEDGEQLENSLENSIRSRHRLHLPSNTIIGGDPQNTSLFHLILPEFFDMIRRLQKNNREFTIVLRTMGIESQSFLDTIKPIFEGKHRDFKDIRPIKINTQIGKIERDANDKIKLIMGDEVFDNGLDIYNKLCKLTGINAIRDDFAYWQKNDYDCYAAKPLWINLNDDNHHHIIFDDNIRLDALDDCIVNIRIKDELSNEFENIDFKSYNLFENSCIVQPNLIELLNPHLKLDSKLNHYFEKIKKSEKIYSKILDNKKTYKIFKKPDETQHTDGDGRVQTEFKRVKSLQNGQYIDKIKNIPKSLLVFTKPPDSFSETDEHGSDENKIITKTCSLQ